MQKKKCFKIVLVVLATVLVAFALFYCISLLVFMPKKFNDIDWASYVNEVDTEINVTASTFNIRYATVSENNSDNNWSVRKTRVVEHIKQLDSDILGLQEVQPHQLSYIKKNISGYGIVEENYDFRLVYLTEKLVILYKTSVFELVESQTVWLSDTPSKLSKYPESSKVRICTLALLRHKESGKIFIAADTHLDHMSDIAREKQLNKLCEIVSGVKVPIFFMGDFNMKSDSTAYKYFVQHFADSQFYENVSNLSTLDYTFHAFYDAENTSYRTIDYCFVSSDIKVNTYKIDGEDIDGKPYSDHYSVTVNLTL